MGANGLADSPRDRHGALKQRHITNTLDSPEDSSVGKHGHSCLSKTGLRINFTVLTMHHS